jgi:hypothetical protein
MNAPSEAVVPAASDDRASCLDNEVSALRALLAVPAVSLPQVPTRTEAADPEAADAKP